MIPPSPLLQQASALLRRGDFAGAEKLLDDALADDGRQADALYLRGVVAAQRGEHGEARRRIETAVALRPEAPDFRAGLGNALFALGHWEEAAAEFRAAVALKPDFFLALNNLGRALCQSGDLAGAAESWRRACALKRGSPLVPLPGLPPPAPESAALDTFRTTTRPKLLHDIEQLTWLRDQRLLGGTVDAITAAYRETLAEIDASGASGPYFTLTPPQLRRLAPVYNRLLRWPAPAAMPDSPLNPALPVAEIESAYASSGPGIIHVDGLLRPEALAALRRFCLEATIWFDFRHRGLYLGAYVNDGFLCDLLLQIAEDLRRRCPAIFRDHRLRQMWAYKYDSRERGIAMHADSAAVNVNFWLTPDAANLDPESGGLVVWDKEAPRDWDFAKYNRDQEAIGAFLRETGSRAVRVPYRQNRAVIFNSDLFHRTDDFRFAPGYENRRINVTMLFGDRLQA